MRTRTCGQCGLQTRSYAPRVAGLLERLGMRRRASAFVDRIGILRPLRLRDFALLWTGLVVSFIGDGIYIIAIAWQTYDLSNSPSALAAVGIAWSLPQVVLLLASGVLSDRLDRRHLMIAGDVIRGIAIGTIGFLSIVDALTLPILITLVVVYGAGQAIFGPAFSSIVPTIVPDDLLVQANSLGQFVRPVAWTLIGPVVGGALVASIGPGWAFVADAGTFVFSAVMIFAMRTRHVSRPEEERTSPWADLVEGLRYVRSRTWLWVAMVAATVSLLATWGPWEVLVPFVVRNDLNGSAAALGLVYGAGGVGAVTAAIVLGQRGRLPRRAVTVLYVAWTVGMGATAGFGVVTSVWQAMLVALVAETSITILIVIWFTLIQRLVPSHLLGRVSSLDWMISIAGVPASFAIVGPAADVFGVDATLIAAGVLGGALTLVFMFYPGARAPERDGSLEEVRIEPEGAPVTT
jgi:Transmembrane secretion effector